MKNTSILCLLVLFLSSGLYSAQNGFEVMSLRPATDGGRYLGSSDSEVMGWGDWYLGTTLDYSYRPLQLFRNGIREDGVIDNIAEQHVNATIGLINERLQFGASLPIGWWLRYKDPRNTGSVFENKRTIGDVMFNFKVGLLSLEKYRFGLAILPFVSVPTGNSEYFYGNGVFTAGGTVITEFKPLNRVFMTANLGIQAKKSFVFRENDATKLLAGLGISILATQNTNIFADLLFKGRLAGLFKEKAESPLEALAGMKYNVAGSGFILSGAVGGGIINGTGAPQYRVLFGLGYSYKSKKEEPKAPVVEEPIFPSKKVIYFRFNSTDIENYTEIAQLDLLIKELKKDTSKKVVIEGNADIIGTKQINGKISKERAIEVAKYLNQNGIDASRMTVKFYGYENPVADNYTSEGRKLNRRTEIKVE